MEEVKIKEVNTSLCDTLALVVEVNGVTYSGFLIKDK